MLNRTLLVLAISVSLVSGAAQAAATSGSATTALVGFERSRYHNTDVERPACYVLQSWAQCSFGTGHGMAEVNAWMQYKNGAWAFLGQGGGVTTASMLESWYHIPPAVARAFQAKQ